MNPAGPGFGRVAVLGTGLIGGSVAGALRTRRLADEVVGYDPKQAQAALELGLVDRVAATLHDALAGADIVVLAAPVPVNCTLLRLIGELPEGVLAPRAVITDVSSTKGSIVAAARDSLGGRLSRFVAAHPIAGSERHGAAAAKATLFDGCVALLCPSQQTAADAIERIDVLWKALGARVSTIDPQRHDALFAAVSHWPHAVAFALSAAVAGGELAEDARRYAGAGLRDTTRIGASSPELWAGILLDNREASLEAARAFRQELDILEQALERRDRDALIKAMVRGAAWRRSL